MAARTRYAVIGLGLFGRSIARTLAELGHPVLAVDRKADVVQELGPSVYEAVQADATDRAVLEALRVAENDVVFVTIGDLAASILCTMVLRELGVRRIIAKINSPEQGRVLSRLGAEQILFPERDMGERVARQFASLVPLTMHVDLGPDAALHELLAPPALVGKSLAEADVRRRFGVTIVALKRGSDSGGEAVEAIVSPSPDTVIGATDRVLVAGHTADLLRFQRSEAAEPAAARSNS